MAEAQPPTPGALPASALPKLTLTQRLSARLQKSWTQRDYPKEVIVSVSSDGRYSVNKTAVDGRSVVQIGEALVGAAKAGKDSVIIISADALASHQSVITVMEAARRVGMNQITFATQSSAQAGAK